MFVLLPTATHLSPFQHTPNPDAPLADPKTFVPLVVVDDQVIPSCEIYAVVPGVKAARAPTITNI